MVGITKPALEIRHILRNFHFQVIVRSKHFIRWVPAPGGCVPKKKSTWPRYFMFQGHIILASQNTLLAQHARTTHLPKSFS